MSFGSNVLPKRFGAGGQPLNPEQQAFYRERYGEKFVRVQDTPGRPNRKQRRARKK